MADVDLSMEKGEYATIQVLCSLAMGDYDKALDAAALAVTLQPDKFEYLFNLAVCLANKGNNALALKVYQEITEKFPEDDRPYRNMSEIFERRGQYELALTCVKKMLQLGGDKGIGFKAMANYSLEMGNLAKAAEYYEKALAYCENTAPVWVGIAMVFASKGDKEGARQAYRQAFTADPAVYWSCEPYIKLGGHSQQELLAIVDRLQGALVQKNLALNELRDLHFTLATTFNALKDYDAAFRHYEAGNRFRAMSLGPPFSIENVRKTLVWFREHFTRDLFVRERGPSSASRKPVFIVGMPRSGTTLLEQLIASHPLGAGAGELVTIGTIKANLLGDPPIFTDEFLTRIKTLDAGQIEEYASAYVRQLEEHDAEAQRVVDKMPDNFKNLWVIGLLFPQAPILYCVRDARATCLSCFMQDFTKGHLYKSDLRTLGHYYALVDKRMDIWKAVLPNPMLTVEYEELVTNPEATMRQVFQHINLDWDPACLEMRDRKHFSLTASMLQIRSGLNTNAIHNWKKFEKHLGPLLEALAEEDQVVYPSQGQDGRGA